MHAETSTPQSTAPPSSGPRSAPWWSGEPGLLGITGVALVAGGIAWLAGARTAADACWAVGTVVAIVPLVVWVVAALGRGRAGVDLIAVLVLAGTLAVGEYLAGALIALMLATGRGVVGLNLSGATG